MKKKKKFLFYLMQYANYFIIIMIYTNCKLLSIITVDTPHVAVTSPLHAIFASLFMSQSC